MGTQLAHPTAACMHLILALLLQSSAFILVHCESIDDLETSGDDAQFYLIAHTWNSTVLPADSQTFFALKPIRNATHRGLYLYLNAPFYNDPAVPADVPSGSVEKLWQYEVFELFLQAESGNYLEVELAPKGHYLVLELDTARNVLRYQLPLQGYEAFVIPGDSEDEQPRWHGGVLIPCTHLPGKIRRLNAYTIQKSEPSRVYTALRPTPPGKYDAPDFHRLEYFKDVQLADPCTAE